MHNMYIYMYNMYNIHSTCLLDAKTTVEERSGDDYDVRTAPLLPPPADQTRLARKQLAALRGRIQKGGKPEVLAHYRKVAEEPIQILYRVGIRCRIQESSTNLTPTSILVAKLCIKSGGNVDTTPVYMYVCILQNKIRCKPLSWTGHGA